MARLIRHLAGLVLICAVSGCAFLAPSTPPTTPLPVVRVPKGPADLDLDRFDLAAILASVDPGGVCQLGDGGGGGTDDRNHRAWTVICPRPRSDRLFRAPGCDRGQARKHRHDRGSLERVGRRERADQNGLGHPWQRLHRNGSGPRRERARRHHHLRRPRCGDPVNLVAGRSLGAALPRPGGARSPRQDMRSRSEHAERPPVVGRVVHRS